MEPYVYKFHMVRVIDGDTIVADIDLGMSTWLKNVNIRLADIDSYEAKKGTRLQRQVERTGLTEDEIIAKGKAAKLVLEAELKGAVEEGQFLLIQTIKKDSFGRWLSKIFIEGNDQSINDWMLKENIAMAFNWTPKSQQEGSHESS
jgi:micrococcal nuclease